MIIWSSIIGNLKSGLLTSLPTFIAESTTNGIGLVDEEAADAEAVLTAFKANVAAGQTPTLAYQNAIAPYKVKAYSDLWNSAMQELSDSADFLSSILGTVQAAL